MSVQSAAQERNDVLNPCTSATLALTVLRSSSTIKPSSITLAPPLPAITLASASCLGALQRGGPFHHARDAVGIVRPDGFAGGSECQRLDCLGIGGQNVSGELREHPAVILGGLPGLVGGD